jgi:hypothetical protein
MIEKFKEKLNEIGFSYRSFSDKYYILNLKNDINHSIRVLFLRSEMVDEKIHGSRNGNVIQSIGYFTIRSFTEITNVDYLIMAFQNTLRIDIEYIIVPPSELIRRRENMFGHQPKRSRRRIELMFWLMPDRKLYETSGISPEGEWYYLSQGINSRLADKTDWCYTSFLNNWDQLIQSNTK